MSSGITHRPTDSDWLHFESVLERFEVAWRSGTAPGIVDYLPAPGDPNRWYLLLELIKTDIEFRWDHGQKRIVEDYAAEFQELGDSDTLPVELIAEECRVRELAGCPLTPAEWSGRFSSRSEQLRHLIAPVEKNHATHALAGDVGEHGTQAGPSRSSTSDTMQPGHPALPIPVDVEAPETLHRLGRYELRERVGQGAFSVVYRAWDPELHREVAVKVPRAEFIHDSELKSRVLREARSAAQLRHPSIVPIHEVGESEDGPFIVYEYISGPSLEKLLRQFGPTPQQAARWGMQIAEALDEAHRNGIVHRDVKPANILMVPDPGSGSPANAASWSPLLADFGLALQANAGATLTHEGDILGTPAYMSPEQARGHGHSVDPRTDVYSMGAVLFELICGCRPFEGGSLSIIHQVLHAEPPSPRSLRPGVPHDLETICLKAMAKEPDRRYASAGALAADLRSYLRHEPIRARRVSMAGRLWLWGRRNPTLASSMTVAMAVIAIVIGAGYMRAIEERNRFRVQQTARANLYQSLVGEARAIRLARTAGYQTEAWQRLKLASEVETPERNMLQLRDEAVASLGDFVGQQPVTWPTFGENNYAVAYALVPQSELVAVGLTQGDVTFRKLTTGEEVGRHKHGDAGVFGLTFSADGNRMATGDDQGGVSVWQRDGETWSKLRDFRTVASVQPGRVLANTVLLTPDGEQLLTCPNGTSTIVLWNIEDGQVFAEFTGPDNELIFHAALSPDGALLVGVYRNIGTPGGFVVWDVRRRERLRSVAVTVETTMHISFSPDGRFVSCGTVDGAVVFQTSDWERVLFTKGDFLYATAISPTDSLLALPSQSGRLLRIWDLATNREVTVLPHASDPLSALFSEDGEHVAAIAATVGQSWNLRGDATRKSLSGHTGYITQLAFHPSGRQLVSTSRDNSIRFWDSESGRAMGSQEGKLIPSTCLSFAPDGSQFCTSEVSGGFQFWRFDESDLPTRASQMPHGLGAYLWNSEFSTDGRMLAASGLEGVRVWRASTRTPPSDLSSVAFERIATPSHTLSSSLSIHSDGSLVAWVDSGAQVSLWDIAADSRVVLPTPISAYVPHGIAFLPNSRRFVVITESGQVQVWNVDALSQPAFTSTTTPGQSPTGTNRNFRLSDDGRWLVIFGSTVTIWDMTKHEPLMSLPWSSSTVTAAAWSPDRRCLALGSSAGEVVIWEIDQIRSRLDSLGLAW